MLSCFNTPITPMNLNDEHNTKSTILSDIATVNDTCNTILQILQIIVIIIFVIMN